METTIGMVCYLWRDIGNGPEIYLAPKNPTPKAVERGLAYKMNGYGGGMEKEDGGSLFAGTRREVLQECGVSIEESGVEKVAEVLFMSSWGNYLCHFVLARKFSGDPRPSREMGQGQWFPYRLEALPLDKMMDSDRHVWPQVFHGRKFKTTIVHDKDMKVVSVGHLKFVDHF